jgi:hypothetical protein
MDGRGGQNLGGSYQLPAAGYQRNHGKALGIQRSAFSWQSTANDNNFNYLQAEKSEGITWLHGY